jgi:hypothetical protein
MISRIRALPAEIFPHTRRYAAELTAGEGHDRFDFALDLMLNSLEAASARASGRVHRRH